MQGQVGYTDQYYGAGNGRRMRQPPPNSREVKPLTPVEIVEKQMPRLTEELSLDEFEQAVISSILTKYAKKQTELQILQLPQDKMREAMEEMKEQQQKELKAGLPDEKYQLLVDLQENGFGKRKSRKKKKSKN